MDKKILVVDDEIDILKTVCFRLAKAGYEVLTAEDGGTAVEMARTHRPDLVLLDLRLPVKDGFEVCNELKADDKLKGIPVIFLTASAASMTEKIARGYHAEGCIIKPFDSAVLMEKVKSLLG